MRPKGVTLIEVLLSLALGAVVFVVLTSSLLALMRFFVFADEARRVQGEVQFLMVRTTDYIRSFGVDYRAYEEGACHTNSQFLPDKRLCLLGEHVLELVNGVLHLNQSPLHSDALLVEGLTFEVFPTGSPSHNLSQKNLQVQPRVGIDFDFASHVFPRLNLKISTTVSIRDYNF